MRGRARITCDGCRRLFGGTRAFDRHRLRGGQCASRRTLRRRGLWRDGDGVWHMPRPGFLSDPEAVRVFGATRARKRAESRTPATLPGKR